MKYQTIVDSVTFVFSKAYDIGNWFRDHIGMESHHRYESVPRNYLHSMAKNWIGELPKMVWEELDLGTYKDNEERPRPDIILEYEYAIWVVEVKHHYCGFNDIFPNPRKECAVEQLLRYKGRIEKLGWWNGKEVHLAVFWSVNPSDLEKIDLSPYPRVCKYWPEEPIPL